MDSPITGQPMQEIEYEGVRIYRCEQSGGEFLSADALAHVARTRTENFCPDLEKELDSHAPTFGVPEEARARQLTCPIDGTPMDVINYAGDTNVIVDRCPDCGSIWLDRGELERLQIILEKYDAESRNQIAMIQGRLDEARSDAERRVDGAFSGSRFAFINRLVNGLLGGPSANSSRFDSMDAPGLSWSPDADAQDERNVA